MALDMKNTLKSQGLQWKKLDFGQVIAYEIGCGIQRNIVAHMAGICAKFRIVIIPP
jgi:hypothetical protein